MARLSQEERDKAMEIYIKSFDEISWNQLAKMHGVHASSISRIAQKYEWVEQRKSYWEKQKKLAKKSIENEEDFLFWRNQHILDNAVVARDLKTEITKELAQYCLLDDSQKDGRELEKLVRLFQGIVQTEEMIYGRSERIIKDFELHQDDKIVYVSKYANIANKNHRLDEDFEDLKHIEIAIQK